MSQRFKFDMRRPDAQSQTDRIIHGAVITEGTMVAFPCCFPGVTVPLPADESRITGMDVTPDGIVYAGTSGYATHLLVGMFHGITGMVFDMGTVPDATACVAICCCRDRFVAVVNGPKVSRLVVRELQPLPFDLIQEWHVSRTPYQFYDLPASAGRARHAVADGAGTGVVVVTERQLLAFDAVSGELRVLADLAGAGRLVRTATGQIAGRDEADTLWLYTPASGRLDRRAVGLPEQGDWSLTTLPWARDESGGGVYTVDARGQLFLLSSNTRFSPPLAKLPILPIGAMAATFDGRLFISAGEGMARLFCFDPGNGSLKDLGVAVSVMERRRYGYCFGDAVVGRDGEIIFGENDDLGHLWLYFPRIARLAREMVT